MLLSGVLFDDTVRDSRILEHFAKPCRRLNTTNRPSVTRDQRKKLRKAQSAARRLNRK